MLLMEILLFAVCCAKTRQKSWGPAVEGKKVSARAQDLKVRGPLVTHVSVFHSSWNRRSHTQASSSKWTLHAAIAAAVLALIGAQDGRDEPNMTAAGFSKINLWQTSLWLTDEVSSND
jgi:hypothetical protein